MSANSSSAYNFSLGSDLSSCSSSTLFSKPLTISINTARAILILPLAVIILHLACQRWKKRGSLTDASNCDIFTYHLAVMELLGILGTVFSLCSSVTGSKQMERVGLTFFAIPYSGVTFFHVLTCMERYMAVVHPHTYMGFKKVHRFKFRSIIIGCVWLLSLAWMLSVMLSYPLLPATPFLCIVIISFVIISFCSLSVLCALIRPGPGEAGQFKERVDQSKQTAFQTVTVILVVLWLWFMCLLVVFVLNSSQLLRPTVACFVKTYSAWSSLPSSLVLPLLYLQRTGKLRVCCYTQG